MTWKRFNLGAYNRSRAIPFDEKYIPEPNSGCWIWTAGVVSAGYGALKVNGVQEPAHRHSWILYRGPIPEGMQICHKCDTPSCVNPDHLFLGTGADNMADKTRKGRHRYPVGSQISWATLNENDVRAIRSDQRQGRVLAREYGVSPATISNIKRGKGWRHVS